MIRHTKELMGKLKDSRITGNTTKTLKLVGTDEDNKTVKIPLEICSICRNTYKKGDYGSAIEHGRNRRFCNPCFSDILRVNGININDFLDPN